MPLSVAVWSVSFTHVATPERQRIALSSLTGRAGVHSYFPDYVHPLGTTHQATPTSYALVSHCAPLLP